MNLRAVPLTRDGNLQPEVIVQAGGQFVFCGGVIRAWCNRIKPMLPKLPHCSRNLTDRLLTWSQGTATHEPCNSELSPGTARRWTDLPVAPATAPNV